MGQVRMGSSLRLFTPICRVVREVRVEVARLDTSVRRLQEMSRDFRWGKEMHGKEPTS